MNIDVIIIQKRRELKLSQEAFGELIGISKGVVQGWESGRNIASHYIKRVCRALNMTPNELFGWS